MAIERTPGNIVHYFRYYLLRKICQLRKVHLFRDKHTCSFCFRCIRSLICIHILVMLLHCLLTCFKKVLFMQQYPFLVMYDTLVGEWCPRFTVKIATYIGCRFTDKTSNICENFYDEKLIVHALFLGRYRSWSFTSICNNNRR